MTDSDKLISPSQLYVESCSTLRHYSSNSLNIRIAAIAQGIVLLSGAAFLIREGLLVYSTIVSIFGLLFTLFMLQLNRGFQSICSVLTDQIIHIEENFAPTDCKPITAVINDRNKRLGKSIYQAFVIHGPFILVTIGFIGMIFVAKLQII